MSLLSLFHTLTNDTFSSNCLIQTRIMIEFIKAGGFSKLDFHLWAEVVLFRPLIKMKISVSFWKNLVNWGTGSKTTHPLHVQLSTSATIVNRSNQDNKLYPVDRILTWVLQKIKSSTLFRKEEVSGPNVTYTYMLMSFIMQTNSSFILDSIRLDNH